MASIDGNAWGIPGFTVQNPNWPAAAASVVPLLPPDVSLVTLTHTYLDSVTKQALAGVVRFTPTFNQVVGPDGTTIALRTQTATLINGLMTITVIGSNDPSISPEFLYRVQESMIGGQTYLVTVPYDSVSIDLALLPRGPAFGGGFGGADQPTAIPVTHIDGGSP